MDSNSIIEYLVENDLSEVEKLKQEKDLLLLRFYFDLDECVLDAARAYADEESNYEVESKEWFLEYVIPYLYEYANDEVVEIIEEIVEQNEISGEVMAFQINLENLDSVQFMALFTSEENDISIEEVVKEYIS